jgi:hypothetical protein
MKKLEFQYYYKQDGCQAKQASDSNCKCWHDEGAGPYKDQRHTDDVPLVEWRIKPSNAAVEARR